MRKYKLLITSICILGSAGCASKFYIPGNRFLIPENSGGTWKGEFRTGGVGVTQVQVADDITSSSPDTTPKLVENSSAALGFNLGLFSRLDLYGNAVAGGPSFAGLKLQLLGDQNSSAKANNFSLAIAGAAALGSETLDAESSGIKGQSKLKFSGSQVLALMGYRLADDLLFYVGHSVDKIKADVTVQRTQNGTTTTTAEPDGIGELTATTAGLRFGKSFFLNLEYSLMKTKWDREQPTQLAATDLEEGAFGAAIGGSW